MSIFRDQLTDYVAKTGFAFLSVTLFLISFPRSWSLYPLALFMITGLILWILDFNRIKKYFSVYWYLILPPFLYFVVQLVSVILQGGEFNLLETRLMFLLVPVFGVPVLGSQYFKSHLFLLLKIFISGILVISIYLLSRFLFQWIENPVKGLTILEYIKTNGNNIFSLNFSLIEHPSYLSMKVIFAIVILMELSGEDRVRNVTKWAVFLIFSFVIFLSASKAGIAAWIIVVLVTLIRNIKNKSLSLAILLILVFSFLTVTYLSVKYIDRFNSFIVNTFQGISKEKVDWKNLDQRTREWYSAIQIIKSEPVLGVGIAKIDNRMCAEYRKNGFNDEADLNLNAHNQFLEAQMTFGIAGLISLLWMLLTPAMFRKQIVNPKLAIAFVLIISFYLLFESMLNRQWGIMFFLLFYYIEVLSTAESGRSRTDQ
jgi:O-antigen ligase